NENFLSVSKVNNENNLGQNREKDSEVKLLAEDSVIFDNIKKSIESYNIINELEDVDVHENKSTIEKVDNKLSNTTVSSNSRDKSNTLEKYLNPVKYRAVKKLFKKRPAFVQKFRNFIVNKLSGTKKNQRN
ncbi:MAG: hypothetical protein MHPSP_003089, partial [Paramarteilia canceri]